MRYVTESFEVDAGNAIEAESFVGGLREEMASSTSLGLSVGEGRKRGGVCVLFNEAGLGI